MKATGRRWQIIHLIGDLSLLTLSLGLALTLRHLSLPSQELIEKHLAPFALLFLISAFLFYAAGLYDKRVMILRKELFGKIIVVQVVNVSIGVLIFYLFPELKMTPKTVLFIYLIISSGLIFVWRRGVDSLLRKRRTKRVVLLSQREEAQELIDEMENYNMRVERTDKLEGDYSLAIVDNLREDVYRAIIQGKPVVDFEKIYEDLFDRVALSSLDRGYPLRDNSRSFYDPFKRVFDIIFSLIAGIISLSLYPFIILAIKLDDGGAAFIIQERVGQGGKEIKIIKFRSMKSSDRGVWVKKGDERITRVGKVLRKTRLDEIPQLYNVLKGDISLIGPRPDICGIKENLEKEIPYYNIRTIVKPGLSGWAQVNQERPPQSVEETKERLMYDLYYIKHRSILLDAKIALRTLGILASGTGL